MKRARAPNFFFANVVNFTVCLILVRQFVNILLIRIHLTFFILLCLRNATMILEFPRFLYPSFYYWYRYGNKFVIYFPFFLLIWRSLYVPLDTFGVLFCHHKLYFSLSKQNSELCTSFIFLCNIKWNNLCSFSVSSLFSWSEFASFQCDDDNVQWFNFCTTMFQIVLSVFHIQRASILCLIVVDCFRRCWMKSAFTTRSSEYIDKLPYSGFLLNGSAGFVVMVPSACTDDTRLNARYSPQFPFNAQNEWCFECGYRLPTLRLLPLASIVVLFLLGKYARQIITYH